MIGVCRARFEQRSFRRKPCCHRGYIGQACDRDRSAYQGNASLMCERLADTDIALAVRRELGPVVRERQIEIDPAVRDLRQDAQCRYSLGDRENGDGGIAIPGGLIAGICRAAPEIEHRLAVTIDGAGGPAFAALLEVRFECVAARRELRIDGALNLGTVGQNFPSLVRASINTASPSATAPSGPARSPSAGSVTRSSAASPGTKGR